MKAAVKTRKHANIRNRRHYRLETSKGKAYFRNLTDAQIAHDRHGGTLYDVLPGVPNGGQILLRRESSLAVIVHY